MRKVFSVVFLLAALPVFSANIDGGSGVYTLPARVSEKTNIFLSGMGFWNPNYGLHKWDRKEVSCNLGFSYPVITNLELYLSGVIRYHRGLDYNAPMALGDATLGIKYEIFRGKTNSIALNPFLMIPSVSNLFLFRTDIVFGKCAENIP